MIAIALLVAFSSARFTAEPIKGSEGWRPLMMSSNGFAVLETQTSYGVAHGGKMRKLTRPQLPDPSLDETGTNTGSERVVQVTEDGRLILLVRSGSIPSIYTEAAGGKWTQKLSLTNQDAVAAVSPKLDVVGWRAESGSDLWSPFLLHSGKLVNLPVLRKAPYCEALCVSDTGDVIAGYYQPGTEITSEKVPVMWRKGGVSVIHVDNTHRMSLPYVCSSDGKYVAGTIQSYDFALPEASRDMKSDMESFIVHGGKTIKLPKVKVKVWGTASPRVLDVNSEGKAVGQLMFNDRVPKAFYWDGRSVQIIRSGTTEFSNAIGISDDGTILCQGEKRLYLVRAR